MYDMPSKGLDVITLVVENFLKKKKCEGIKRERDEEVKKGWG